MRVYLIRHGQTTGDVENRYGGDYDDHLTEEGRSQSQALADRLAGAEIGIIFHSPLSRAVETAEILVRQLQCSLQKTEALRERNTYGILSGMTQDEARANYPEQVRLLQQVNKTVVEGAESYETFRARLLPGFENIVAHNTHDVIGMVTHGGPIRCLLREHFSQKELKKLGDCAYILLEISGHKRQILMMHHASYD